MRAFGKGVPPDSSARYDAPNTCSSGGGSSGGSDADTSGGGGDADANAAARMRGHRRRAGLCHRRGDSGCVCGVCVRLKGRSAGGCDLDSSVKLDRHHLPHPIWHAALLTGSSGPPRTRRSINASVPSISSPLLTTTTAAHGGHRRQLAAYSRIGCAARSLAWTHVAAVAPL